MSTSTVAPSPPDTQASTGTQPLGGSNPELQPHKLHQRISAWIAVFDWLVVVMVAALSAALHIRFATHVGGLWRDEANSVQLATLPHLRDVVHCLDFDSFPILFFAVLRFWGGIFGVHNDSSLRVLGLLIGLCVLAAIFVSTRTFGARTPVLSLALIGLNPMLIRYGDSIRAYGLGIVLILLTFGSFWRLVASSSPPTKIRLFTAAALAMLSVQCVYYNSVLLLAIIAGAMAVCIRNRAWGTAAIAFSIGAAAAVSLLPYLPMMRRMHEWTFLVNYPVGMRWLWYRCGEVLGSPDPLGVWLWTALFIGTVIVVAVCASLVLANRRPTTAPSSEAVASAIRLPDPVLFAAVALAVAVPAYAGFLRVLKYYTQPWYYIILAAFAACAIDVAFAAWPRSTKLHLSIFLRAIRPLAAFGLVCLTAIPDWKQITTRHTNIDLVAAQLRSLTSKDDLVLVPQWENAVSLSYYYHGPAGILTVPDLPDHRFHRYDLFLQQMMTADAIRPVRERLQKALQSNHSVFIAGHLTFPSPSVRLPELATASKETASLLGGGPFYTIWQLQVGKFLRSHATAIGPITVTIPERAAVQDFENVKLQVVRGWQAQ